MSIVKEIPILFSTEMVHAIIGGRKTMTRRIVKPQESVECYRNGTIWVHDTVCCPYGRSSDWLYVRETHFRYGKWIKDGHTKTGRQKWKFVPDNKFETFRYQDNPPAKVQKNSDRTIGWYKRSSLFMPKSASRIWLEITAIRVERLQDISETDAKAEGAKDSLTVNDMRQLKGLGDWVIPSPFQMHQFGFLSLWCKINGCQNWLMNPWVWVIGFKVLSTSGKPLFKNLNSIPDETV